jgi:hypothetical protein
VEGGFFSNYPLAILAGMILLLTLRGWPGKGGDQVCHSLNILKLTDALSLEDSEKSHQPVCITSQMPVAMDMVNVAI